MSNGSRGLGHALAVVSAKPVSIGTTSALRNISVADEARDEGCSRLCNSQTVAQCLNEAVGKQLGLNQVAASRSGASDIGPLTPATFLRDKEALSAATIAVLQLLIDLRFTAMEATARGDALSSGND